MKSIEMDNGGPVMPRSKSRATVKVVGQCGVFEMTHAGRPHARLGQPVVEPGGGPISEIGADRLVDRCEHLQQDEHSADKGERAGQAIAALHGAHEHAHRDGEDGRQHTAQQEQGPPDNGKPGVCLRQYREEFPLVAIAQAAQHVSQSSRPRVSEEAREPPFGG